VAITAEVLHRRLRADGYPEFVTLQQAAELSGFSAETWRAWKKYGGAPVPILVPQPRQPRIRLNDLAEWLATGKRHNPVDSRPPGAGRPRQRPRSPSRPVTAAEEVGCD